VGGVAPDQSAAVGGDVQEGVDGVGAVARIGPKSLCGEGIYPRQGAKRASNYKPQNNLIKESGINKTKVLFSY
jgi:hypothetical protein